jgi:erythronate-4-phosphate dehydrogenase
VNDADALLVRSITKVNEQLIQDTALKFVGSATIGTDHLDIPALEKHQIAWSNAAGCNAQAVAEYVITALLHLNQDFLDLGKKVYFRHYWFRQCGNTFSLYGSVVGLECDWL